MTEINLARLARTADEMIAELLRKDPFTGRRLKWDGRGEAPWERDDRMWEEAQAAARRPQQKTLFDQETFHA